MTAITVTITETKNHNDGTSELIDASGTHIYCEYPRYAAANEILQNGGTPAASLTETGDVWSVFEV
jgi:hypothetical protein